MALLDEARELDRRRREGGLSLGEAARRREIFLELSRRLADPAPTDRREYLRVPRPVLVRFSCAGVDAVGIAQDFGGGGLFLSSDQALHVGDVVRVDRVLIDTESHPLDIEARVVRRTTDGAGLCFTSSSHRIERVFYILLDLFLRLDNEHVVSGER